MGSVNINEAKEVLKQVMVHGIETGERIPVMLKGPAGLGKSDIVAQVTEELNTIFDFKDGDRYELSDVRLSSMNPVDVRGLPYRDEITGRAQYMPVYFFPAPTERRVIFLDEINAAPPATQVTAYEMARNFSIGGRKFPNHTLLVLAGNRTKDKGATFSMPKPLENRLLHVNIHYDISSFTQWALSNGINDDIIAFLQFRPDLLGMETPPESSAFPSPRTWAYVSSLLNGNLKAGRSTPSEIFTGLVGEGAGAEFEGFLRLKEQLPSMDRVLNEGIGDWDIKSKSKDIKFAFAAALAGGIKSDSSGERMTNFTEAFKMLPPEFQVICFWLIREMPSIGKFITQPGVGQMLHKLVEV